MLTLDEFLGRVKAQGSMTKHGIRTPWESCTAYQRHQAVARAADEYRQDELISSKTRVAAVNWAEENCAE